MAGLYIHIPFCKSRCLYCDFFSTTQLGRRTEYVNALIQEWHTRADEAQLAGSIETIYLGGGTPSLLEIGDLQRLFAALPVSQAREITLECNPGDITPEKSAAWRQAGINRLSIGIQSFNDTLLRRIGRRHTAEQAKEAVRTVQDAGFENISIDIIYGLPEDKEQRTKNKGQLDIVKKDVEEALQLGIQHISTYCLTFEEGTPLSRMLAKGEITETDEDTENAMYDYIAHRLAEAGFEHYEVSNFALSGKRSLHNSNYWNNTPYIGLGAGAHSYNGTDRSWNPDDLHLYIKGIQDHTSVRETEHLSATDRYNEQIMLGLRTADGIPCTLLHDPALLSPYIDRRLLRLTPDKRVVATLSGLHILNQIIEDLVE